MAKEIIDIHMNKSNEKTSQTKWWLADEENVHKVLVPLVQTIAQRQNYRRTQNIRHARLYNNQDILGYYASVYGNNYDISSPRLSMNVCASIVDTLASKIAKQKTRPVFLTEEGVWGMQQKAKKLQKFIDGMFHSMGHYETKQAGFVHAGVFGTGATKFYISEGEVHSENTIIDEIIVDDLEGIYGCPQNYYQYRFISRDILVGMFPKHEGAITSAKGGAPQGLDVNATSDMVMVTEAWHMPSAKKAKDGRHTICIDGATLSYKPWKLMKPPFTFQRYKPALTGFYGIGAIQSVVPIQLEINRTLMAIQKGHIRMAVPRVFLQRGSKVNKAHLTNETGSIVEFDSAPPIFDPGIVLPAPIYAFLQSLWAKAYEQEGVSQLSAASQKPSGLDSGRAIREYQDIESDRFQLLGQRLESSYLEDAEFMIEMTKELAASGTKVTVMLGGYAHAETINWKEVEMDEDKYVLKSFPASILPTTPAGKLQTVQELMQSSLIDRDTGLSLLDFPDLKDAMNVTTANQQLVKKQIDNMIESGQYSGPEPYFGLEWAKKFAQLSYLRAKMENAPEERLELVRTYISDCDTMLGAAAQAAAQAMQPPPGMAAPGGALPPGPEGALAQPMAPPQSDLLPF